MVGALATQDEFLTVDDVEPLMGLKKADTIRLLLEDEDWTDDEIQEKTPVIKAKFEEILNDKINSCSVDEQVIKGAPQLINMVLRHGGDVGLTTGFSQTTVDIIREKFGLVFDFDSMLGVYANAPRPEPDAIVHLASMSEKSIIFNLGDTIFDVQSGKNAKLGENVDNIVLSFGLWIPQLALCEKREMEACAHNVFSSLEQVAGTLFLFAHFELI